MPISFVGAATPVSVSAATSLTFVTPPAAVLNDLMLLVLGFEGVGAGSGPWVSYSGSTSGDGTVAPVNGWGRILWQPPSATGSGLEVWAAYHGAPSGGGAKANFVGSETAVAVQAAWSGVALSTGIPGLPACFRAATQQQWAGANPQAPSIYAFQNELVIAVGAQGLSSPGFGTPTPTGWATRTDAARAGTYGNVECVISDMVAATGGDTGAIPYTAAVSGSPKGAMATIAIRPLPPAVLPTGPGSAPLGFRFKPA